MIWETDEGWTCDENCSTCDEEQLKCCTESEEEADGITK